MAEKIDITGLQSGLLTVLYPSTTRVTGNYWVCRCECGNTIEALSGNLRNEHTRSCGCLKKAIWLKARTSHAMSKFPEYKIWKGLRKRIHNPNDERYSSYGGRGLTVDPRWDASFEVFLEDMGRRPGSGYSIERVDNDKGYWPDNCRWATGKEQANNRRTSRIIEYKGVSKTLAQWAEELNLNAGALRRRLQLGWSVKDAFETPVASVQNQKPKPDPLEITPETTVIRVSGKTHWVEQVGIPA